MIKNKLSKRLFAAAEECREGAFIADVGTDHAYLPVYLAREGKIRGAVASDINEGPILRARANIDSAGLSDRITALRCDGLSGLEKYDPEDIFILGMGGELIARIIDDAPFLKAEGKRLILQPMTHSEILRRYLLSEGFEIIKEKLVKEDKIYQLTVAKYTGKTYEYTETELLLGRLNIESAHPLLPELVSRTATVLKARIVGKKSAGVSAETEEKLLSEMSAICAIGAKNDG